MGFSRTPIKKGTHTPSSSAKKKGANKGPMASPTPRRSLEQGGKYGFCPKCAIGRRIRSAGDPRRNPIHRDKFRFTCSRKSEVGCDYLEILDSDPADNPGLYQAASSPASQAKGGDDEEEDQEDEDEEEDEDEDDVQFPGQSKLAKRAMAKRGLSTPTKKLFGSKNSPASPAGKNLFGNKNSPAGGKNLFGSKNSPAGKTLFGNKIPTSGKDTPQKNIGCPECIHGKLTEKIKSTFSFMETILVCEKVLDPQTMKVVGGCGYSMEIGRDGNGAGAQAKAKDEAKKNPEDLEREKKELDDLVAAERAKALANPNAAVVMAGPVDNKPGKKVLVDLTEDDEVLRRPAPAALPANTMVGAQAPIVIDDDEAEEDEAKDGAEFDDVDSADEREMMRMAGGEPKDAADFDDDSVDDMLIELADKVQASQR